MTFCYFIQAKSSENLCTEPNLSFFKDD